MLISPVELKSSSSMNGLDFNNASYVKAKENFVILYPSICVVLSIIQGIHFGIACTDYNEHVHVAKLQGYLGFIPHLLDNGMLAML